MSPVEKVYYLSDFPIIIIEASNQHSYTQLLLTSNRAGGVTFLSFSPSLIPPDHSFFKVKLHVIGYSNMTESLSLFYSFLFHIQDSIYCTEDFLVQ